MCCIASPFLHDINSIRNDKNTKELINHPVSVFMVISCDHPSVCSGINTSFEGLSDYFKAVSCSAPQIIYFSLSLVCENCCSCKAMPISSLESLKIAAELIV